MMDTWLVGFDVRVTRLLSCLDWSRRARYRVRAWIADPVRVAWIVNQVMPVLLAICLAILEMARARRDREDRPV